MANELFFSALKDRMEATAKNEEYMTNPTLWAKEIMGVHLWSKQQEIANALVANKKVGVSSCHGSGKSFLTAVLIMWWVCTRQNMDSIAMVTAPTYAQLHNIIFESLRKGHAKYGLPGTINQNDEWKSSAGTMLAFGRKPNDKNAHAFQGIHRNGGVLVGIDEAVGVADTIFTGAEAVTTGNLDKILAIFNPDDVSSYIGQRWLAKDPSWHFITISAFDTPNFTGEWIPDDARNGLVSVPWVEEKKLSWGEESPVYKSKVLGQFSLESSNSMFSPADLLKGHTTEIEPSPESRPRLGVDVARYGEDSSTVYLYHDGHVRKVGEWYKTDLVTTAEKVHDLAVEHGCDEVRVDGIGIGAGVVDMLARMSDEQYIVVSMSGSASSPNLDKWANVRAYWYDNVREKLSYRRLDTDIDDKKLSDELSSIQYHFKNNRGSLQLEKKDEIRTRIGKSPDYADAFVYASADLGFDPKEPMNQITPGQEIELLAEQMLFMGDFTESPW